MLKLLSIKKFKKYIDREIPVNCYGKEAFIMDSSKDLINCYCFRLTQAHC